MNMQHDRHRAVSSRRLPAGALLLLGILLATNAGAYPLDGFEESGIARLLADVNVRQAAGGRLGVTDIRLHLLDRPTLEYDAQPQDPALSAGIAALLAGRDPSYALVVVDFAEPDAVRWAALQPDLRQNPGSVGKILTMLGLFDSLARAFPDVAERERILRTTAVTGGDWVHLDSHQVPHYEPETGLNRRAVPVPEDVFLLSEWVDHAISASANAAGSVIWREAMLLRHFGAAYPPSAEASRAFFRDTPKGALGALARRVIAEPMAQAGLDERAMIQGSFWTRMGKAYVPGAQSYATPRELARFMIRMEQGRLVDAWSSLAMKKYLYVSKRRYRYIYAPELAPFATYFKSGSLYQCEPEEGFRCGKYMGNVRNLMNSVTTVESLPETTPRVRYSAALMSNVLRFNSAWDHSRIGAAVHELVTTDREVKLRESATEQELREAGTGD